MSADPAHSKERAFHAPFRDDPGGSSGAARLDHGPAPQAADAEACKTVRMSDPGWTDITSTNAILGNLLEPLGYEQKVDSLGVPITFEALKNSQIDAFLGNWMPAQAGMVDPLVEAAASWCSPTI